MNDRVHEIAKLINTSAMEDLVYITNAIGHRAIEILEYSIYDRYDQEIDMNPDEKDSFVMSIGAIGRLASDLSDEIKTWTRKEVK